MTLSLLQQQLKQSFTKCKTGIFPEKLARTLGSWDPLDPLVHIITSGKSIVAYLEVVEIHVVNCTMC